MNNSFKTNTVTFTNKPSLTLKIKFKTGRTTIYEASNLIDNEADYCCSERLIWFFSEFSHSCETSKMFKTSIKYAGVYQAFDYFFWCILNGTKYSHGYLGK